MLSKNQFCIYCGGLMRYNKNSSAARQAACTDNLCKEYNDAAQAYNVTVRQFPANIVAMIFKFKVKPYFEADESASAAPKVEF